MVLSWQHRKASRFTSASTKSPLKTCIWFKKLCIRSVVSSDVCWILRQWGGMMAIYVTRIQHQSISCQLISCQSAQATLFRSQNRARRIARTSLWRRPSPVSASTNIILTSNFNKTALITNTINRILGKNIWYIYLQHKQITFQQHFSI